MKPIYVEELENAHSQIIKSLSRKDSFGDVRLEVNCPFSFEALFYGEDLLAEDGFRMRVQGKKLVLELSDESLSFDILQKKISERFEEHLRSICFIFSYLEDAFNIIRNEKTFSLDFLENKLTNRARSSQLFFLLPYLEEISAVGVLMDFSLVEEHRYDYAAIRIADGLKFVPVKQFRLETAKNSRLRRFSEVENPYAQMWIKRRLAQINDLKDVHSYFGHTQVDDLIAYFNSPEFETFAHSSLKVSCVDMSIKIKKWKKSKIKLLRSQQTEKDIKVVWSQDKFFVYELLSKEALNCEGLVMRNCLKEGDFDLVANRFFSLRDEKGNSLVCLEWDSILEVVAQIKGFANQDVKEPYLALVGDFLIDYLKTYTGDSLPSGWAKSLGLELITPFSSYPKFTLVSKRKEKFKENLLAPWGWNPAMLETYLQDVNIDEEDKILLKRALNTHYLIDGLYVGKDLKREVGIILKLNQNCSFPTFKIEYWLRENRVDLSVNNLQWEINKYLLNEKNHEEILSSLSGAAREEYLIYLKKLKERLPWSRHQEVADFLEELASAQKG